MASSVFKFKALSRPKCHPLADYVLSPSIGSKCELRRRSASKKWSLCTMLQSGISDYISKRQSWLRHKLWSLADSNGVLTLVSYKLSEIGRIKSPL